MNHNMRKMFTEQQIADLVSKGIKDGEIKLPLYNNDGFDIVLESASTELPIPEEHLSYIDNGNAFLFSLYDNDTDNTMFGIISSKIETATILFDDVGGFNGCGKIYYDKSHKKLVITAGSPLKDISITLFKIS